MDWIMRNAWDTVMTRKHEEKTCLLWLANLLFVQQKETTCFLVHETAKVKGRGPAAPFFQPVELYRDHRPAIHSLNKELA